jgi:hypothetical protein
MNPLLLRVRNRTIKHVVKCEVCSGRGWLADDGYQTLSLKRSGKKVPQTLPPIEKCFTCNGVGAIPVCRIAALIGVPTKTLVRIHTGYSKGSKCGARIVEKMFEMYPFLSGAA